MRISNFEDFVNENLLITEKLQSSILRNIILASKGDKDFGGILYKMLGVALDKITDSMITEYGPDQAKSFKGLPSTLLFWVTGPEGATNNRNASGPKKLHADMLIAITNGEKEFVSPASKYHHKTITTDKRNSSVGYTGHAAKGGWDGHKLTNTAALAEVAGKVYVLDMKELANALGPETKALIKSRAEQKAGALALMSNKQIKAEATENRKEILRNKFSEEGLKKSVEEEYGKWMDKCNSIIHDYMNSPAKMDRNIEFFSTERRYYYANDIRSLFRPAIDLIEYYRQYCVYMEANAKYKAEYGKDSSFSVERSDYMKNDVLETIKRMKGVTWHV